MDVVRRRLHTTKLGIRPYLLRTEQSIGYHLGRVALSGAYAASSGQEWLPNHELLGVDYGYSLDRRAGHQSGSLILVGGLVLEHGELRVVHG